MLKINLRENFPFLYSVFNKIRRDIYLFNLRKDTEKINSREIFGYYFKHNLFGDAESLSGTGSSLKATQTIQTELPVILKRLNIKSLLDIPCGDFYWAKEIDWSTIDYIGADVVPDLIARNIELHGNDHCKFLKLDILEEPLPQCDLILCRDLFIHFPNDLVLKVLNNIKESKSQYLLTTHYTEPSKNKSIKLGSFRPINLTIAPFFLPAPEEIISDNDYLPLWGRTLSLWKIEDLPQSENLNSKV